MGKAGIGLAVAAVVACGGHPADAAAAGLLGQWRFDDAGQIARDDGPHGLDGRLGEVDGADHADPARIEGVSGGALRFDGTSFVRVPDAPELAPETLSVEALVRAPSAPGPWRYIVSRGGRGCFAGSYGLYTADAAGIAFYVFDGSGYVVTATARPEDVWNGAWHHVAGTFDGDQLRLYVDGRPVGDPALGHLQIDYASTTATTAFGRYVGSCDLSYRGDLDQVRMWSGALSASAIAESAGQALPPGSAPPPSPLPAASPPIRRAARPPAGAPKSQPGAPRRACAMKLSRTRIAARRRTPVRVRVTVRGKPVRAVRVVARRHGRSNPITAARTGARGRARLVLRVRRPGRLRISAATRPSCSPRYVRVSHRWAGPGSRG
jgi:hypothetical protein